MKLIRLLQRKCHIKRELCLSVLRLFQFGHFEKISEVHFRLLGRNGFHEKAENERFTAAVSHCHQNLKNENFTSSFGRLPQKIAPESVPHAQHDYFSSLDQSYY